MSDETSRRDLFRRLAGRAAEAAGERLPDLPGPPVPASPRARPVAPAERLLGVEQLDALADERGLGARVADVRRLARVSWRIVDDPVAGSAGAWWWGDGSVGSLGTLDLDALRDPGSVGPGGRVALAFDDAAVLGADGSLVDCGLAWISPAGPAPAGAPARVVPELVLPRAWTATVGAIGLDGGEVDAWEALRAAVAEAQGATLFDVVEEPVALHRALGYPDERQGLMAERCAEAGDADATRWRLLIQLSADAVLGSAAWPVGYRRLYLWIADAALAEGDFSDVRTFVQ